MQIKKNAWKKNHQVDIQSDIYVDTQRRGGDSLQGIVTFSEYKTTQLITFNIDIQYWYLVRYNYGSL